MNRETINKLNLIIDTFDLNYKDINEIKKFISYLENKSPSKSMIRSKSPSKSMIRSKSPSKSMIRSKSPSKSISKTKSIEKSYYKMNLYYAIPLIISLLTYVYYYDENAYNYLYGIFQSILDSIGFGLNKVVEEEIINNIPLEKVLDNNDIKKKILNNTDLSNETPEVIYGIIRSRLVELLSNAAKSTNQLYKKINISKALEKFDSIGEKILNTTVGEMNTNKIFDKEKLINLLVNKSVSLLNSIK